MRRAFWFLLVCVIFSSVGPIGAREYSPAASPLHAMLALVPASAAEPLDSQADIRLSYSDFRAMVQSRAGAPQPASWDEFNALADTPAYDLWVAARVRYASVGPMTLSMTDMWLTAECGW